MRNVSSHHIFAWAVFRPIRRPQSFKPQSVIFAHQNIPYRALHIAQRLYPSPTMNNQGDLNNSDARRPHVEFPIDPTYDRISLAILEQDDDPTVRAQYRPFLLSEPFVSQDWVAQLELSTMLKMVENEIIEKKQDRLRILVLSGSLRSR
jgi:hypothetical protein